MLAFSYGFTHVNQVDADRHLIDSTGMRKYSEWQSPATTYWGPSANGVEGRLVYKFDFSAAATSIRLKADSPTWNFFVEPGGSGRGASALEVSKDGTTWISLRNNLEPRNWGGDWSINDSLPSSILGTLSLFVRMRFFVESAPNSSYTVAQFGRSTSAATSNVFEVNATFGANVTPIDIALSAMSIVENAGANAILGTLSTADPDAGNTFIYTLVAGEGSADNAVFTIVGNEVRTAAAFDYETRNSFTVRVRSTDQGGLFTEKAFAITVSDVVEDWVVDAPAGQPKADAPRTGSSRLVKRGPGTLVLDQANSHTGGTTIEAGEVVVRNPGGLGVGRVVVAAGARLTIDIGSFDPVNQDNYVFLTQLDVHPTARVEIGTGQLRVAQGGFDPAAIRGLLLAGRNGGRWDGGAAAAGFTSAAATLGSMRAVGYRIMTLGELRVGFAAFGDANLDGQVNSSDMNLIVAGAKFGGGQTDSGWWQGDFNYDGRVTNTDIGLITSAGLGGKGVYLPGRQTLGMSATASLEAWAAYAPADQPQPKRRATRIS